VIEIIRNWEDAEQQAFFVVLVLAAVVVLCLLIANIRIVLRGYRPSGKATPDREDCSHPDNLTGLCLKRDGNCQTRDECRKTVREHAE
jgi:hypothetical protein